MNPIRVRKFIEGVRSTLFARQTGPRWLRGYAADAVLLLERAMDERESLLEQLEQKDRRIAELEQGISEMQEYRERF